MLFKKNVMMMLLGMGIAPLLVMARMTDTDTFAPTPAPMPASTPAPSPAPTPDLSPFIPDDNGQLHQFNVTGCGKTEVRRVDFMEKNTPMQILSSTQSFSLIDPVNAAGGMQEWSGWTQFAEMGGKTICQGTKFSLTPGSCYSVANVGNAILCIKMGSTVFRPTSPRDFSVIRAS